MKRTIPIAVLLWLTVAASCPKRPPPESGRFVLMPASGPAPMAVATTCTDDLACDTIAGQSACTVSQGCVSGECKFAVAAGPTCPCYEGDIRWCGSGTSKVQFCAEIVAGQTGWQAECGPSQAPCTTAYPTNPVCSQGSVATIFDVSKAQWIPTPGAACTPTSSCPAEGQAEKCTPRDPRCTGGIRTYSRASGWSACEDLGCPVPCVPSAEVCNGRDDDCNGIADDIPAESCAAPARGDCAAGHVVCNGSVRACVPALPANEVCGDGRDNDCDGRVDVNTTRDETVTDITVTVEGGAVGTSINRILGPANCNGDRLEAGFARVSGDGDCWVVGWANDACRANPDATAGNSTIRDACQMFWEQGGDNGRRDCRYIAHSGNAWWTRGECRGSFRRRVPACQ
ncbi:MAG: hypothetical protein IPL61_28280 [Myxococcales bacterium]|nr:hypothetical protein [Myxococcales bacterium]